MIFDLCWLPKPCPLSGSISERCDFRYPIRSVGHTHNQHIWWTSLPYTPLCSYRVTEMRPLRGRAGQISKCAKSVYILKARQRECEVAGMWECETSKSKLKFSFEQLLNYSCPFFSSYQLIPYFCGSKCQTCKCDMTNNCMISENKCNLMYIKRLQSHIYIYIYIYYWYSMFYWNP